MLILRQRLKSQPQTAVELAPEYRDAQLFCLFNDGYWLDLAGRNVLTATVPPRPVIRPEGESYEFGFGGAGRYVVTASTVPSYPRFTVFAWVRPSAAVTGYRRIIENSYASGLYLGQSNTGNQYNFIVAGSALGGCVGGLQVIGKRDFVAGVFDGTNRILYVNGKEVARATATTPALVAALCIGTNLGNVNGEYWPGDIDTVGYFPRAFPAGEILALYENPFRLLKPQRRLYEFVDSGVPPVSSPLPVFANHYRNMGIM